MLRDRIAIDLFAGERRLERLVVAGRGPARHGCSSLTAYGRPIVSVRWRNPDGRTIGPQLSRAMPDRSCRATDHLFRAKHHPQRPAELDHVSGVERGDALAAPAVDVEAVGGAEILDARSDARSRARGRDGARQADRRAGRRTRSRARSRPRRQAPLATAQWVHLAHGDGHRQEPSMTVAGGLSTVATGLVGPIPVVSRTSGRGRSRARARAPRRASSVRFWYWGRSSTPSFANSARMCVFTPATDRCSSSAICLFSRGSRARRVRPAAGRARPARAALLRSGVRGCRVRDGRAVGAAGSAARNTSEV